MTFSLKHSFTSPKADGTDATLVQPSNWNAEHTITLAAGKVLGRDASGAGAVQELPLSFDATGQSMVPPSGTTAQRPATATAGMLRYNTTTSKFELYNGTTWGSVGGGATISDTAPSNPQAGDLWWKSDEGQMYVYYTDANSSQWVIGNAFAGSIGGSGTLTATTITSPAATALNIQSAGTTAMTVDTSQNVGIGGAASYSWSKLQVVGYATTNGLVFQNPYETIQTNAYYSGSWKYIQNGAAWGMGDNFGGPSGGFTIALASTNSSGANAALTWNPKFSINSNGQMYTTIDGFSGIYATYGCRAWVNFDGSTASPSTRRGSGNVSSVTKNGTGDYTLNFASAMPDANYAVVFGCGSTSTGSPNAIGTIYNTAGALTTTTARIWIGASNSAAVQDWTQITCAVFR